MVRFLSLATALLLSCAACQTENNGEPMARGREIYELCAQCHGPNGAGNKAIGAPAIAGQHSFYIAKQLRKFKSGMRGAHPDDSAGLSMRPMALSLKRDDDIERVAAYVAQLSPVKPVDALTGGKVETGAALYGPCSTCHGADGKGDPEKDAPALVRTNDWYLLAQLQKFKARIRGSSPDDAEAALMFPWVQTLADEQAMKDVLAHVQTLR